MRWKKKQTDSTRYWKWWFAWRPVTVEDTGERVWFERVWRHDTVYGGGMLDSVVERRYRSSFPDDHDLWQGAS